MLFRLLTSSDATQNTGTDPSSWILMGILLIVIIVFMVFSRRSQKKREEETRKTLDAIKPGNKVKTIGGICGTVVEVCNEDNTFILETGSEETGKSYIRFDKQAVYQTDAKAEVPAAPAEETPAEEAPAEEVAETPVEETRREE